MVKEYTKKYSLYTAAYYEHQAQLLSQYQEKKKQIEEYLLEIKDVIIDDVRDAMRDKRQSIDACMTVNAPKTPGMTMRRTKRKKEEKRIEIDVDSPNTSIVSFANEVQESTASKARFTGCSSRMDTTPNTTTNTVTPTNTMTPNRTQSAYKQTRLQTLLEQNSVNLTPTGSGRATRFTRAKAKLLEQSLINSTISSMQSAANTPTLKTKLLDKYKDDCAVTPVQASLTPQNKTRSTVPNDTDNAATPQNQTAVSVTLALEQGDTSSLKKGVTFPPDQDVSATPEKGVTPYQGESSTPTVEFPAANSTMVQPGTPAAPFGANITLITNTPAQSTPVGEKAESLLVSSPIGPIATNGTPTSNPAIDSDKNTGDWVLSTGKRKSSKVDGKSTGSTKGPESTPLIKRLQLSTCQPSPVPVATPAEKQPALLSLTIPATPTPENITAPPLFPSPIEEAAASLPTTPQDADLTRTPNMADIRTPGALCRTPGLKRVKEVVGALLVKEKERERSGNDLVFAEKPAEDLDDEVEVSFGAGVEDANDSASSGLVKEDQNKVEIPAVTPEERKSPQTNEEIETHRNSETKSTVKSSAIDHDASMNSDNSDQKDESMESEENINVPSEHIDKKAESESDTEAMDVAEILPAPDNHIQPISTEPEHSESFSSPEVIKEETEPAAPMSEEDNDSGKETVMSREDAPAESSKTDSEQCLADELKAAEEGNDSNQLFESCDEGEGKESEVEVAVEQFTDARQDQVVEDKQQLVETEEEAPAPPPALKTPVPVRQTRSSRNRKLAESKQKNEKTGKKERKVEVDKKVTRSQEKETAVEENEEVVSRTRSTRNKKVSAEDTTSSQGTVKKIAAGYENISKKPVKETGIPTFSAKHQTRDERLDMSKREREDSEIDSMDEKTASADESVHLRKKMKDNAGEPRNPQNLVTSVMSFVNKPTVVVKSAKELEQEKKEAAKKKIEEKEAKAQQVLNKKKQRENEMRLKRIEKDKRMRQAKQNKEDEAKRKKADLEERMRKKEETSAKEREFLAKKEEEKRQRELKKQEQAEHRRKQAEKARELKKKKLQEEAEERKVEALRRKQELDALKVRELEKHRLDEEARMDEQKKLEAEELQKRLKAEEERRKLEEEIEKKKTTPSRTAGKKQLNLTGAGTLLGATPPPRPPPRTNKHTSSKIPTKLGRTVEEAVPERPVQEAAPDRPERPAKESARVDLEEASNVCSEVKKVAPSGSEKRVEQSVDRPIPLTKTTSGLLTPIAQQQESVDSPSSAASSRIQSYMKNKLLSLGQSKTKRNLGNRLDAISEDNTKKPSTPTYDPRDNYKIDDIESGDDTDDETKPKRTVPNWARNKLTLNESLRKQFSGAERHSAKTIFGPYPKTADLDDLFGTVNRYKSRTSSAHWTAPPSTGNLDFSILTEEEINHANNILLKYK